MSDNNKLRKVVYITSRVCFVLCHVFQNTRLTTETNAEHFVELISVVIFDMLIKLSLIVSIEMYTFFYFVCVLCVCVCVCVLLITSKTLKVILYSYLILKKMNERITDS